MLLMVEKGIRSGICHAIHIYPIADNKYMKNYDKNISSSYLTYLDANNLYAWGMLQKLPVKSFKWVKNLPKFNKDFTQNYDENSDKGYIIEADVKYPKKLFSLHKDLPFLTERKKIEKFKKLVCSIHDKENFVVHIRVLKQPLNNGLILKNYTK